MDSLVGALLARIVVAVDGSDSAGKAARIATNMARALGSEMIILTVVDGRAYDKNPTSSMKRPKAMVEEHVASARKLGARAKGETVKPGESTVEQIINYVTENKADLLVVGTRGLGGFKRMLLGSVSSGVIAHASCSVLVVR